MKRHLLREQWLGVFLIAFGVVAWIVASRTIPPPMTMTLFSSEHVLKNYETALYWPFLHYPYLGGTLIVLVLAGVMIIVRAGVAGRKLVRPRHYGVINMILIGGLLLVTCLHGLNMIGWYYSPPKHLDQIDSYRLMETHTMLSSSFIYVLFECEGWVCHARYAYISNYSSPPTALLVKEEGRVGLQVGERVVHWE